MTIRFFSPSTASSGSFSVLTIGLWSEVLRGCSFGGSFAAIPVSMKVDFSFSTPAVSMYLTSIVFLSLDIDVLGSHSSPNLSPFSACSHY